MQERVARAKFPIISERDAERVLSLSLSLSFAYIQPRAACTLAIDDGSVETECGAGRSFSTGEVRAPSQFREVD